jgi:ribosomal protein L37AE/L43A
MVRMVWLYSIPLVTFAVIGVLAVRRVRGRVHCSSCVTPISARRRSLFRLPFGGWVCPHCGTQLDSGGRRSTS